jgi:hypothetical protein
LTNFVNFVVNHYMYIIHWNTISTPTYSPCWGMNIGI